MGRIRAIAIGLVGGVALAGGLTYTMNAGAYTCCDPWGIPGQLAFITAGNTMTSSVTSATQSIAQQLQRIEDTLANGFGKTYTERTKQNASTKTIQEGMVQARTQVYIEARRADAMMDLPNKEDFDQTVVNSAFLGEQVTVEQRNRIDLGNSVSQRMVHGPYANPSLARFSQHGRWCTPLGAKLGLCNAPVELGLGNADAKFETVVGREAGLTYSDARRNAAVDFVTTVVASDLRAQLATDTAQAQEADALTVADQAYLSLASASFLDMAAERTRRNQAPLAMSNPPATGGAQ